MAVAERHESPGSERCWLGPIQLRRRIGRSNWIAETEGGEEVVARRASLPDLAWPLSEADVVAATAPLLAIRSARLVPVVGVGVYGNRAWLASAVDSGVSLRRLLETARPSPAQGLILAADVLSGLDALHTLGANHPALHSGNVLVGIDGVARLADWATMPGLPGADTEAAGPVLGEIIGACSCPASEGKPESRSLGEVRARLGTIGPAELSSVAEQSVGDRARRYEVRAELAAIVGTFSQAVRGVREVPAVTVLPAGGRQTQHGPKAVPHPAHPAPGLAAQTVRAAGDRRARRALWGLAAAVAAIGLIVGLEVTFLHGPITREINTLKGSSPTTTATAATNSGPALVAPPAAGPIRSVDVRALHTCSTGSPCELTVLVGTAPQRAALHLAWSFDVMDRCSSASVTVAGGTATVAPGQQEAVALDRVKLPSWPALYLVAVTASPARAASSPLPVPATARAC